MSCSNGGGVGTRAVRAGRKADPTTGAILTPIFQSTTYVQSAVGVDKGHTYSRASNPTVSALEEALGSLEDAPAGVCFSSGLAAVHAVFLAYLKSGDHVVVSDVVYGGTYRLLKEVLGPLGVKSSFVDTSDVRAIEAAIGGSTKLAFAETPGNPTLKLTDVKAAAEVCARRGVPLVVDNTFLTPLGLRPLDLGATVSVYSTTKYIEGHNATIGGALVSRDETLIARLRHLRKTVGSIQSPFEAWLTLRGLTTLPIRLRQQSSNALAVARWLEKRPGVTRVAYPGLDSHPQRGVARKYHQLNSGIIAFEVEGGEAAGREVMKRVKLCSLAESLGAVETLITHPATMTHGSVPRDERVRLGITDGLIRLSVGLEEVRDIIEDLDQAIGGVVNEAIGAVRSTVFGEPRLGACVVGGKCDAGDVRTDFAATPSKSVAQGGAR